MVLRVALFVLATLSLLACGQAEPGASPDTTPIGAAPTNEPAANTPTAAPLGSTPDPSAVVDMGGDVIITTATPAATAMPGLQPTFTSTPAGQSDGANDAVARAQMALAARLGVAPQALSLVQVEDVEWSDSGLGCPNPDEAYMQVIIAGQRIVFSYDVKTYAVHTDGRGGRMIWCNGGKAVALK